MLLIKFFCFSKRNAEHKDKYFVLFIFSGSVGIRRRVKKIFKIADGFNFFPYRKPILWLKQGLPF